MRISKYIIIFIIGLLSLWYSGLSKPNIVQGKEIEKDLTEQELSKLKNVERNKRYYRLKVCSYKESRTMTPFIFKRDTISVIDKRYL